MKCWGKITGGTPCVNDARVWMEHHNVEFAVCDQHAHINIGQYRMRRMRHVPKPL